MHSDSVNSDVLKLEYLKRYFVIDELCGKVLIGNRANFLKEIISNAKIRNAQLKSQADHNFFYYRRVIIYKFLLVLKCYYLLRTCNTTFAQSRFVSYRILTRHTTCRIQSVVWQIWPTTLCDIPYVMSHRIVGCRRPNFK